MANHRSFNILGNIAIVNFSRGTKSADKRKFALEILKRNKFIKTVLEKSGKFSGRLRKMHTKHLAGEKNKEVLYKENNCFFRFNIDRTYFSPRLSNERKEISSFIKKDSEVLVMFAGVAPFSIVIAKNSKPKKVYSNEINREANKYAELNAEINGVKNKIEFINGDIKKIAPKLKKADKMFDFIVMPRPNLKESFLEQAFMLSKKGTKVYYYDFCKADEVNLIVEKIKKQAERFKKKIKILKVKPAGEIAPYKIRVRVDFEVL
jgi:tRNA (guanine37-N1)-methyltransferase